MPSPANAPTPRNQFSFSRVKTFHQCSARYRYRYLKGLKELFRSVESYLGSVVHDVLEWLYSERDRSAVPSLAATLARLDEVWAKGLTDDIVVIRCGDRREASLVAGLEMIERFHRGALQRDRSSTVALEQRLTHHLPDDLIFTGFADRIGRTENGRLFVIDYKTSKNEGNPSDFSEGLQAPLYAACAMLSRDEPEALAGYHYLRHDTTSWQSVNDDRAQELLARFHQLAVAAKTAVEFPAQPGILCAWCGFNALCPAADVPPALAGGLDRAREIRARQPGMFDS